MDSSGMGFSAQQGYLTQEDAQDAIQRSWHQLVKCYDSAGSAREFASGIVKLRFLVDGRGRVSDVHVLESRLGSLEVERCLISVGRTVAFPQPQGGGATPVEYSMEFRSSGRIPVVELPEGELDRQFAAWLPQLAADCRELVVDDVTATFYVAPSGAVRSVGFASPALLSEEAASCLSGSLRRWTLRAERSSALRRAQVALRRQDLLNPPDPTGTTLPDRRAIQGRRGGTRR